MFKRLLHCIAIVAVVGIVGAGQALSQTSFRITAVGLGRAQDLAADVLQSRLLVGQSYSLRWERTGAPALFLQYSVTGANGPWISALRRNVATQREEAVRIANDTAANGSTARNNTLGNLILRPVVSGSSSFIRLVNDTLNPTIIATHTTPLEIAPPPPPISVDSTLRGSISAGQRVVLRRGIIYGLDGYFYVDSLGVLVVEPGAIIVGDTVGQNSAICVNRGGIIVARGTAQNPIVMTSRAVAGQRRAGDWGGLLIAGRARINTTAREAAFEGGIAAPSSGRGWYGGDNDNDSSGVVEYTRIEFAGIAAFPNEELNSLTLGAVGRRTQIRYVQCSFNNDDAFEWFGGTVDAKYIIAYATVDDDFDGDFGWTGRVQYAISRRFSQVADQSTSQAFEMDNDGSSSYNTPRTAPIFSNVTAIGPISDTSATSGTSAGQWNSLFGSAAQIRRNARTSIVNSIFAGWPRAGIELNGVPTTTAALGDTIFLRNNTWVGIKGSPALLLAGGTVAGLESSWILTPSFNNALTNQTGAISAYAQLERPFNEGNTFSVRPNANATLYGNSSFAGNSLVNLQDSFFDRVAYRGAIEPGIAQRWDLGWTSYDPVNFNYQAGGPTVSVRDAQGNPVPSISKLDVALFPNPTAQMSTIRYNLLGTERVTVRIVNVLGAQVATIFENRQQGKGIYEFSMNVESLPIGTYFVQILTSNGSVTQQLNIAR